MVGGLPERLFQKDPGFQPPTNPLDEGTKARAKLIYRDVPNVTIQNTWTVPEIRFALSQHMYGIFENSAQLVDSMLGDDRVQATLGSRIGGLFGREIRYKPPKGLEDSRAYRECEDAWRDTAEELVTGWALTESHAYGIFMAFAHGQIVWDTSQPIWRPQARPWHPRFEFFEWTSRKFVAITQDGTLPILVGDGKWYGHQPFGTYRSWIRGAVRAVAEPWAVRHFAIRDWAGFSEVHGGPTRVGYVPAASDPGERAQFERNIARLGHNTSMIVPRGVDKDIGYGYELVEASDWAAVERLCREAVLALHGFSLAHVGINGSSAKPLVFRETARQLDARHAPAGFIVAPCGTGQEAPHHHLDRKHLDSSDEGRPPDAERHGVALREDMVGHDVSAAVEPPGGDSRQHLALVRDGREHPIVRGDPVACHEQEGALADDDVAHLPPIDG